MSGNHTMFDHRLWLGRAIGYAQYYLDRLADIQDSFPGDGGHPTIRFIDKVAAESCMLLYVADRAGRHHAPQLARVGAILAPLARDHIVATVLMRHPARAAPMSVAHSILHRSGHADARFEDIVVRALDNPFRNTTERPAFRDLEAAWLEGVRGSSHAPPDLTIATSLLVRPPHPIYASTTDCYALTHDVMYVTDFGARGASFPGATRLLQALDACLVWATYENDLDLAAELVMAILLLADHLSPAAQVAICAIAKAWSGDPPRVPGPSFVEREYTRLPPAKRLGYEFLHSYHTTFVVGILAATAHLPRIRERLAPGPSFGTLAPEAAVRRGLVMLAGLPAKDARSVRSRSPLDDRDEVWDVESLQQVVALLSGDDGSDSPALAALAEARLTRRCAFTWLIDALLIRACRTYDLPMLLRVLAAAPTLAIYPTPTLQTACRFLLDQRFEHDLVGAQFLNAENRDSDTAAAVLSAARRVAPGLVALLPA